MTVILRIMRRVLFVFVAAVLFSACGGGSKSASQDSTTTSTPGAVTTTSTSTTLAPRSTTTQSTTTTTDPTRGGGDTPEQASAGFENTWEANSKTAAKAWGDQAAIDVLFRTSFQDTKDLAYLFQACAPNAGFNNVMTCSYTYEGGSMHFIMSNAIGKWRVTRVEFVAD